MQTMQETRVTLEVTLVGDTDSEGLGVCMRALLGAEELIGRYYPEFETRVLMATDAPDELKRLVRDDVERVLGERLRS